jgi:1-acyl-sn-glycerol-3-phosphate acyltransferase
MMTRMGLAYDLARTVFARSLTGGIHYELRGAARLPRGAAVLVCNHASDADPGILMRALPEPVGFLAAPFMGRLPIFRTLLRHAGSVAIESTTPKPWREQVHDRLRDGAKIVVFPEGQAWLRAQDFDAPLAPFRPGFAAFAYDARVPVVPLVIRRVETEVVPFATSPLVRRFSGNPEELEATTRVMRYRRCVVEVLAAIPAAAFTDRPRDEAVPWLVREARARMKTALGEPPDDEG